MDEEKDQQVGQAPQPDSQDLPPSPAKRGDKPMTKGQRQRRQRSVFQYIAILKLPSIEIMVLIQSHALTMLLFFLHNIVFIILHLTK